MIIICPIKENKFIAPKKLSYGNSECNMSNGFDKPIDNKISIVPIKKHKINALIINY